MTVRYVAGNLECYLAKRFSCERMGTCANEELNPRYQEVRVSHPKISIKTDG